MSRFVSFCWMIFCIVMSTLYFTDVWVPTVGQIAFIIGMTLAESILEFLKACANPEY